MLNMKQNLHFKLNQHLAMTPQLQQAIRLLQLSTHELQQEIQVALENNPLLEQDDDLEEIDSQAAAEQDLSTFDSRDALEQKLIAEEPPLDANWDALYTAGTPSGTGSDYTQEEFPIYQGETYESLQDYLNWQADLTPFNERERIIATAIIDAIDSKGYLSLSLLDLKESIGDGELKIEDILTVLRRIQHFDPLGVAARSLRECLLIQLDQLHADNPVYKAAALIINLHINLLASHDYRALLKVTKLREVTVKKAIELILSLDPRPGESFIQHHTDYVIPDIVVRKGNKNWHVELNSDALPQLRVNQHYAGMIHPDRNPEAQNFIRNHLQNARWLIRSLQSRNDTLLRVADCIVNYQQAFFEKGAENMRPMVLADVAQSVDMHESTISRVTSQKYLHCCHGVFELKYFFSSHVSTDSGIDASSTAIRALIKKIIANENPTKPLSDSKLTSLLEQQGVQIARRTVAKYRELLSIPAASQRKKLV